MGTLKRRIQFFCCLLTTLCIINPSSLWAVKRASIVMCAETGQVFHEQNADAVTPPASLTKMMTLYLTFKALREQRLTFDQHLPVSKRASQAAPCKLWLKPGSTITVRHAILGMVTKSANDASIAIAETLGKGSEAHFATLMTQEARRLGMTQTIFRNSHGLPEKQQSVTSARDMAILSRCLYKHFPEYFKFFKEEKFAYKGQVHTNHNHLLGRVPGLDGIKTGFINASGFNLAASVVRDNRRIIAVVMGGESAKLRDNKMVKLLEATYSNLRGQNRPCHKRNDCSIEDLICTLETPQAQATPLMRKAVMRSQCRPAITQAKYTSVGHILDDVIDDVANTPPIKKRIHKPHPQVKKTKAIKKNSHEKVKKTGKKKTSQRGKRKK